MSLQRAELYTQNTNECTIYTILNIWRTSYWIILNKTEREEMIAQAEKDWVWSEKTGAVFTFIYNWATLYFKNKFWLEIEVISETIESDNFDTMINEWYSFWIWLLYASNFYRRIREDWIITLKEIEDSNTKDEKYAGHNICYKLGYVIWILKSIPYDNKLIKFDLEALKLAVEKGFFYPTARTFKLKDELVHYYAKEINKGTNFKQVEQLDKEHRLAFDVAMSLRILRK